MTSEEKVISISVDDFLVERIAQAMSAAAFPNLNVNWRTFLPEAAIFLAAQRALIEASKEITDKLDEQS